MATLHLEFEGYYQMRMATDPDPPDDPRGLSGYTFALPGEPDFDRKLHFQPDEKGAWPRVYGPPGTPGPQIGVRITQAREGDHVHSHLIGARVRFVDAELVERNGAVVRNDLFAIDPLLVRIEAQAADGDEFKPIVERLDLLDPEKPEVTLLEATAGQLRRRQLQGGFTGNSEVVARATGFPMLRTTSWCAIGNSVGKRSLLCEIRRTPNAIRTPMLRSQLASNNSTCCKVGRSFL